MKFRIDLSKVDMVQATESYLDNPLTEGAMEATNSTTVTASSIEKALSMADAKYKSEQPPSPDKWGGVSHKYTFDINGNKTYISVEYSPADDKAAVQGAITKAIQNFSKTNKAIIPELTKGFYDNDHDEWLDKKKYSRDKWVSEITLNSLRIDTSVSKSSGNRITSVTCCYYLPGYGGHVAEVECYNGRFIPGKSYISMQG